MMQSRQLCLNENIPIFGKPSGIHEDGATFRLMLTAIILSARTLYIMLAISYLLTDLITVTLKTTIFLIRISYGLLLAGAVHKAKSRDKKKTTPQVHQA
jgi:hypothetical protein